MRKEGKKSTKSPLNSPPSSSLFFSRVVRHPQGLLPLPVGAPPLPPRVRQRVLRPPAQRGPRGGRGHARARAAAEDRPHVPQEDRRGDHAEPREILCPAPETLHRHARLSVRQKGGAAEDTRLVFPHRRITVWRTVGGSSRRPFPKGKPALPVLFFTVLLTMDYLFREVKPEHEGLRSEYLGRRTNQKSRVCVGVEYWTIGDHRRDSSWNNELTFSEEEGQPQG